MNTPTYDARTKQASGQTFLSFYRQAEEAFLNAVLGELKALPVKRYFTRLRVVNGVGISFLEFEGTDRGDMGFDGTLSVTVHNNDVTVHIMGNSVYRGNLAFDRSYKVGVLTTAAAVSLLTWKLAIGD